MFICSAGDYADAVKLLLEHSADVNVKSAEGVTALHGAAHQGALESVQLLVNYGADVDAVDNKGATALDTARTAGHTEVVEFLEKLSKKKTTAAETTDANNLLDNGSTSSSNNNIGDGWILITALVTVGAVLGMYLMRRQKH
jgi:ankyrin repeat protein